VIPSLEALDWNGFLARPQLPSAPPQALENLCRQPILITGAGGSIGSALALRLAPQAQRLVLLESSESHLFALQRQWSESAASPSATFVLGDIADTALLDEIFSLHAPRLVFHAAAFKHVPLMEEQPLAAIANNIYGTLSLVTAASAHRARVVLLSTDKAVEPASVMGATKRVAEQIALAAGGTVLRLGNVLASRDSVAELFANQIAAFAPLSITDPAARRYFLTLGEAVELLLSAAAEPDPPVLLAPDLPTPQFIADLARFMARNLAPGRELPIHFTRPRAGDKESEQLWASNEKAGPAKMNGLRRIDSPLLDAGPLRGMLANLRTALDAREIPAALDCLCALVPDYSPSRTVLALCAGTATTSQACNE
jgi:FlaA1/EpsC-like NDP-sugar epimerase